MKEDGIKSCKLKALRQRAEALLHEKSQALSNVPPEEIQRLIHELQVHQIELEMQNEELRQTQSQLAKARDKYVDLYDFAPVGYYDLDKNAIVMEANLTGANLLDVDRRSLINSSFTRFIAPDFQDIFYFHRQRVVETATRQTCELKLIKNDGTEFYGLLESIAVSDAEGKFREIRTAIADITQCKRAEYALEESRSTIQALIDAAPESALLVDTKGNVMIINEMAAQRLGKSKEGVIGRSAFDYLPPEVAQHRSEKLKKVFTTGKQLSFADERDGRHFYNSLYPIINSKGAVEKVAIFAQDLTLQHQTELALRESEEKYRLLFENDSDAVMIFDAETRQFEDANQSTLDLYGYSKEEFLTLNVEDISAEKEKTMSHVKKIADDEAFPKRVSLRFFKRKDNTVFPGEISAGRFILGGRQKILGAVRDISERVNAQEDLRKSEKRYRDLFNSIPIGLYRTTPEGSILDVNPAMLDILGYPDRNTLLQEKSLDIYIDRDERKRLQHLLEEKGFVHDLTVQLRRHDGMRIWVSLNATMVRDPDRLMTYYEGAMADITERKESEERIHQLSQQLIQAQEDERHMISRELHDTVAQDLSVAKMACDLIYAELSSKQLPEAQRIQEISGALQKTILGVRNMAYDLRPPGLEELGLVETIYRFCEDFTQMYGLPVDFQAAGLKNLKLDYGIQINIYRLVQEGLTNIRKHAAAERAALKLTAAFPNIILRVEDNGQGFDVQARAAAADREKRMGLRSMQERVTLLNGKMKLQSKAGQGTKVFIKLPFAEKKRGAHKNHFNR